MTTLKSPITIGKKIVKNRILMPPLVCFNWANQEGIETVSRAEHYGQRSKAETAFIVIEAAGISAESRIVPSELGIWDDSHIQQYQEVANECHKDDAVVIVQIVHAGAKAYPDIVKAPSKIESVKTIEVLTVDEIQGIKDQFVQAAMLAKRSGLDGVEVHGAHNYLLNQFTSPLTNLRDDNYGGSVANRYKLSVEVVSAIRKACGEDFIISYRFGVNDPSFKDDFMGASLLEEAGVDLFNVSSGIGIKTLDVPDSFPGSFIAYMGFRIKEHVNKPVASVYDIRDPELAHRLVEGEFTDMVAIGRALLADPKWSKKALAGEPVNRCYHCKPRCKFSVNGHECPWHI